MKRTMGLILVLLCVVLSGYAYAGGGRLVENIRMLGYPENIASSLAKEIEAKNFSRASLQNNTIASAIVVDGKFLGQKRFCWDKPGYTFKAERYNAKGFVLYRIVNKGHEMIFRLDVPFQSATGKRQAKDTKIEYYPEREVSVKSDCPPEPPEVTEPEKPSASNEKEIQEEKKGSEEASYISHEPLGGAYAGGNQLTRWHGGWVKYKANFHVPDTSVEPGVGFLGSYTWGGAKSGGYRWQEYAIGPLFGIKKFGEDSIGYPWMIEADIAPQFYHIKGDNHYSGYRNKQEGWRLNARTEAKKTVSENWTIGSIAEGNIDLGDTDFFSTWSGDSPSDRSSLEVGGYGLYRINDDWEYQIYGGVFHQWWDDLTGVKVIPLHLKYKKWLNFGVGTSFYPFGLSDNYDCIASARDLFTPFGFIWIDGGVLLRQYTEEANQKRVKEIPK